jgi:hypothetical protein
VSGRENRSWIHAQRPIRSAPSRSRRWGAQPERARRNFRIGAETMPLPVIRALALIKRVAAQVNCELKLLNERRANAIVSAADETHLSSRSAGPTSRMQYRSRLARNSPVMPLNLRPASPAFGRRLRSYSPLPREELQLAPASMRPPLCGTVCGAAGRDDEIALCGRPKRVRGTGRSWRGSICPRGASRHGRACSRSRTTCACSGQARAAGSESLRCPKTSPGPRSCLARSIRLRRKR